MPEFADAARGKSWECACSQHGNCRLGGCVCACHYRLGAKDTMQREIVQTEPGRVPNPPSDGDVNVAPAASVQAGQHCSGCNKTSSAGAKFCRHCGNPFVVAVFCENCGAKTTTADSFCENCGAPVGSSEVKVKSPRKKKVNGNV